MSNEEMIATKMEAAIARGASPRYPLTIAAPATRAGTLELEFEGRTYRVSVEDLGETEGE